MVRNTLVLTTLMDRHTYNYPYDPWCNTCGRTISMSTWNENDGECDKCKQRWEENSPDKEKDNERTNMGLQ